MLLLKHTQSILTNVKQIPRYSFRNFASMNKLDALNFDNTVLKELPVEKREDNSTRTVRNACFSKVKPTPLTNPKLVSYSKEALALIDLDPEEATKPEFTDAFTGNSILNGSQTAAHCYCGFQFGSFAGQLGDGRAMYLGEIVNKKGERWELQLKGAGQTPYSRRADGRAVLRSSIREYLCSEAMYYMGIPTTRAGSLTTSDTRVARDLNYDGNVIQERSSVVLRLSPTFIRFGSFHIANPPDENTGAPGPSDGNDEIIQTLLNYTLKYHYSDIWKMEVAMETKYGAFFEELVKRTAETVAKWQSVGFVHGVLNTDNMSIIGVTMDYGPYGFMDNFDPDYTSNSSDEEGRYSYRNQPKVCAWNLARLAESLMHLIPEDQLQTSLNKYYDYYTSHYLELMRKKLGLLNAQDSDSQLIEDLFTVMANSAADFNHTFRSLTEVAKDLENGAEKALLRIMEHVGSVVVLAKRYRPRIHPNQLSMLVEAVKNDPTLNYAKFVLQEQEKMEKYQKVSSMTEEEKLAKDKEEWASWLAKYQSRLHGEKGDQEKRIETMNSANPSFILRNWILQVAIDKAEALDFTEVNKLLEIVKKPYEVAPESKDFAVKKPLWAFKLCNSCSS